MTQKDSLAILDRCLSAIKNASEEQKVWMKECYDRYKDTPFDDDIEFYYPAFNEEQIVSERIDFEETCSASLCSSATIDYRMSLNHDAVGIVGMFAA